MGPAEVPLGTNLAGVDEQKQPSFHKSARLLCVANHHHRTTDAAAYLPSPTLQLLCRIPKWINI
jgi:hypothetical protein